jgi:hypothetical protein
MDDSKLPRHIIERNERRWAEKIRQDARAWQTLPQSTARPTQPTMTESGIPVVRQTRRLRRAPRTTHP